VVLGPVKVVKIRSKYVSVVLARNDKTCTPNNMGMFRVPNQIIRARFSSLLASVVPGPEKVMKIRQKHYSVVPMGNNKNGTTNSVGMLRLKN